MTLILKNNHSLMENINTQLLLWIVIFIIMASSDVQAKGLYVSTNGDDNYTYIENDVDHTWATLGRAVWGHSSRSTAFGAIGTYSSEAAQAGDVLHVMAGTYTTDQNDSLSHKYAVYSPINSGTAENYITIRADGRVVLNRAAGSTGGLIGVRNRDYIIWDGFYMDTNDGGDVGGLGIWASDTGPIVVWGSSYVTIRNCEVKGHTLSPDVSDNFSAIRVEYSRNINLASNRLYDIQSKAGEIGHNGSGVTLYNSDDVLIENNVIYHCETGISVKESDISAIQERIIIRKNFIYENDNAGINISGVNDGGASIYQNVLANNTHGVKWFGLHSPGAYGPYPENARFINNTVVGGRSSVMFDNWAVSSTGNVMMNNIFYGPSVVLIRADELQAPGVDALKGNAHILSEHNLFYDYPAFANIGYTDYTFNQWRQSPWLHDAASPRPSISGSDPLFLDTQFDDPEDVRIGSMSPAINAGTDYLDLDNDGQTTNEITMGAYITGNEQIGPIPSSERPAAPGNLTIITVEP